MNDKPSIWIWIRSRGWALGFLILSMVLLMIIWAFDFIDTFGSDESPGVVIVGLTGSLLLIVGFTVNIIVMDYLHWRDEE